MTYSIIIPVYNEKRTIPILLQKLNKLDKNIEIIIIDDGSTDGTKALLKNDKNLKVIINQYNMGKGFASLAGINSANNENIILYDGDLEVDIEDIPRLITIFERKKCDVLVGTRWISDEFFLSINYFGNVLINTLFNLLYKSNLNDVLCCVKILKKETFKSLQIKSKRFSFEAETMAKIVLNNLSIKEVQIKYSRRTVKEGKKLKLSDGWMIIWNIIKIKFNNR